jgi:hypothetical protein
MLSVVIIDLQPQTFGHSIMPSKNKGSICHMSLWASPIWCSLESRDTLKRNENWKPSALSGSNRTRSGLVFFGPLTRGSIRVVLGCLKQSSRICSALMWERGCLACTLTWSFLVRHFITNLRTTIVSFYSDTDLVNNQELSIFRADSLESKCR